MDQALNLDQLLLAPPASITVSGLMCAGIYAIGLAVFSIFFSNSRETCTLKHPISFLLGIVILVAVFFPLSLWGMASLEVLRASALFLTTAGAAFLVKAYRNSGHREIIPPQQIDANLPNYLLTAILLLYCLTAMGPITETDSLDYHVGVALSVLDTQSFPFLPEWFHSRLAGSGEVLIALGLSIGAEQFGTFLQLGGLLTIGALLHHTYISNKDHRAWIVLGFIASPIFVAWATSPKPLILPISMTSMAVLLFTDIVEKNKNISFISANGKFFIGCIFAFAAATMKLNFILSALVSVSFCLFCCIRLNYLKQFLLIAFCTFSALVLPFFIWKSNQIGGDLFGAFTNPFPGNLPGYAEFLARLKKYSDSWIPFPGNLFLPPSLGKITTVLGIPALCFALFLLKSVWKKNFALWMIFLFLLLSICLGQSTSRFFLEPAVWLIITQANHIMAFLRKINDKINILKSLVFVQALAVTAMLGLGFISIAPSLVSSKLRSNVMSRVAFGFSAMEWANNVLPEGALVLSAIRSKALSKNPTLSFDWRDYVEETRDLNFYMDLIATKKPQYFLLSSGTPNLPLNLDCKNTVFAGPFKTARASRNPLNAGAAEYVLILNFDEKCIRSL